MYIYNLPHAERKDLCRILDQNNKWEDLAGTYMQYDVLTIQELRREVCRGHSPSDELLTLWGHQNHTVLELFTLLSRMHHYQAMTKIKKFVPFAYHRLIHEGERNPEVLLRQLELRDERRDKSPVADENLETTEKILNVPQQQPVKTPVVEKLEPRKLLAPDVIVSREENDSIAPAVQPQVYKPRSPTITAHPRLLSISEISTVATSPHISYEELTKATNNWDESARLGKGGFGTVYKGIWKCTQVAIKRIDKRNDPDSHLTQLKQSITELHCLNSYRHDNILPLYGYSIGGPQPCLVYQYMPGGCLEMRLKDGSPAKVLRWPSRLNIAVGTARGLQFLHRIGDKPLVHGDIKPANILLDPNDQPRIGDFGLAREGPQGDYTHIKVSRIHGTKPYLPEELLRGHKFSTKVDTYSFGVVLFQLATAMSAHRDKVYLRDFVLNYDEDSLLELKDRRVEGGEEIFGELVRVGKRCVQQLAKNRPEMEQVFVQLEEVALRGEEGA